MADRIEVSVADLADVLEDRRVQVVDGDGTITRTLAYPVQLAEVLAVTLQDLAAHRDGDPGVTDPELAAMAVIVDVLEPLDPDGQRRIVTYLTRRYGTYR